MKEGALCGITESYFTITAFLCSLPHDDEGRIEQRRNKDDAEELENRLEKQQRNLQMG